ncbi:MAG: hypothetical protein H6923_04730 [Alphaproteobacteria bacterium]|nr:hypothetical protein [Alphaproteobacteria bacterium]
MLMTDDGATGPREPASLDADELARPDLIPGFPSFFGALFSLVPFAPGSAFTVVVIGVGSGLVAECFKHFFPNTLMFLADPDPDRLDIARARIAAYKRVSTFQVDPFVNPLPVGADVTFIGLGGLRLDAGRIHALYERVAASLKPGGRLIVADRFEGGTPALDERTMQAWIAALKACDPEPPAALIEAMARGRGASIAQQFEAMASAGLKDIDVWYKEHLFAVLCADKPDEASA